MMGALREPPIIVEPRPVLNVGDKVKLSDTARKWTVRGVTKRGRFVILTQPFNLRRTVLYTVIDFDRGVRGRDDMYGMGYETDAQVADALHEFQHTEDQDRAETLNSCPYNDGCCLHGAEVSFRGNGHVRLDIQAINDRPTDWSGR